MTKKPAHLALAMTGAALCALAAVGHPGAVEALALAVAAFVALAMLLA